MNTSLSIRRRLAATVAVLAAGIVGVLLVSVPGALGAYSATVTNSTNTLTTAPYLSCTSAATGLGATIAWPLDDSGVLSLGLVPARDVSTNNRTGAYTLLGVQYQQAATACPRDPVGGPVYTIVLNGSSGFVTSSATVPMTNTFTEAVWFRTGTTQGGRIMGFGDGTLGASTRQSDRHIYMTNAGKLVFGVFSGSTAKTVTSPLAYNDNAWHQVVASLGSTGMQLYVDGKPVVADTTTTTAQTYTPTNVGYLRLGYDNLSGWPTPPASNYFSGALRFADYFASTLTATQVNALYLSGTGS